MLYFYGSQCLIGSVAVREATHARHDAEHVVVHGVHTHLRGELAVHRAVREREVEHRVVDAAEDARAAGLVLLWLEAEGVDIDTNTWYILEMLIRLNKVEVATIAL